MRQRAGIVGMMVAAAAGPALADDTTPPRIVHEPCSGYEKGKPFEVVARFLDESELFDPKVIYWTKADPQWRNIPFQRRGAGQDFVAVIPTAKVKGAINYFIEVFDVNGNGPARMGSGTAPIVLNPARGPTTCQQVPAAEATPWTVSPSAPPRETATPAAPIVPALTQPVVPPPPSACDSASPPLYCSGWLWTTVAVVLAAGGGTAVYFFALRKKEPPAGPTYPDVVTLVVSGPDPTAAAQ